MKVFVTGGNGFLGSRTLHELVRKGYEVRCLLREKSDLRRIRGLEFESRKGDVRNLPSLLDASEGCDAIIHLAGISSWEQIRSEAFNLEPVIVEGTRNVLEAARINAIPRTVIISSSAAINGSRSPEVFNERSAYKLSGDAFRYAAAKRAAEKVARTYVKRHGLDVVIVNPCEVYGPDDDGLITAGNLIDLIDSTPAFVCTGGTAVAHVDDIARGIVLALEKGRKGERYILGGDNLKLSEIARIVRKVAEKSDRVITLPNALALSLSRLMETFGMRPPVSRDILEYATLYWFMNSAKAVKELGYSFRPAEETLTEVTRWLINTGYTKRIKGKASLRYGSGGAFDARAMMIRAFGALQGKKVVILDSNPRLCGEVLAASETKGTFLEHLLATPAWAPIYSIESMDGERWEQLSEDFKKLLGRINWRERLAPLTRKSILELADQVRENASRVVDSEAISRLVVRVLFELLFEQPMSIEDETLFYQASLEWRKEIAIKGKADSRLKARFWKRLGTLVSDSKFKDGLETCQSDPSRFLSLFAQPFLISPQINIGDIFVTVFHYLRADAKLLEQARHWARGSDKSRLGGIILESIRLRHPFPILERELKSGLSSHGEHYEKGTQFFILLDQFKQDQAFDPERWLQAPGDNPYYSIPFAAGPRMCIGKPIAMELLVEMLKALVLQFPLERVQPELGHRYSGRDNDGQESLAETGYQAAVFGRALWKSFRIGRARPEPVAAGCPWKKAMGTFSDLVPPRSGTVDVERGVD